MVDIYDENEDMAEDTQKGKLMVFETNGESYGLELEYVNEIIGIQPITEIPEVEEYIRGLINLRGKIVPVIDVRIRFGQKPYEYTDRTCIIIVNVRDIIVGLIVEKIEDVLYLTEENIEPPPVISMAGGKNRYIIGLGKTQNRVILILNPERLLGTQDYDAMEEMLVEK